MEAAFDATIVVIANDDLRAERAGARGTADLEAREGQQLSQREKAERATFIVDNEGIDRRPRARAGEDRRRRSRAS